MNGLYAVIFAQQRFTNFRRLTQTLLWTCLSVGIIAPAYAEPTASLESVNSDPLNQVTQPAPKSPQEERNDFVKSVRSRKLSVDQTLRELGLEAPRKCLDLSDPQQLSARKKHWASALNVLNRTHHDELINWIIGKGRPPGTAIREAESQKNCLLTAIVTDVNRTPHKLRIILDFGYSFEGEINGPRQLSALFNQTPTRRREIFNKITQSGYRNANSQSQIWTRKYSFEGRSFNVVSDEAGQRCGLESSQTWKPGFGNHKDCWHNRLSAEEREREILQASSAPGISRHHWATDFDFFSLNTKSFIESGPHHGDYLWMQENALNFGYFQPYKGIASRAGQAGYMEERWHWSYLPIAQALYEFVKQHDQTIEAALFSQWDEFEARSNRGRREAISFFPFVRANWRSYMFHVDAPNISHIPRNTAPAPSEDKPSPRPHTPAPISETGS